MAIIYFLCGFLLALFLPNRVDDIAKSIVKYLWTKIIGYISPNNNS